MGLTLDDVEGSNFDVLTQAGTQLGTHATTMQQHQSTGQQAVTDLTGGWEGAASQAATSSATRTLQQQQRLSSAVQQVQSVLSEGGAQLAATRSALLQGVEQMRQQGWQVGSDGTVSVQAGSRLAQLAQDSPVTEMQLDQLAATNSVNVKQQLADLQTQDEQLAQKLRDAVKDLEGEDKPDKDDPDQKKKSENDKKDDKDPDKKSEDSPKSGGKTGADVAE